MTQPSGTRRRFAPVPIETTVRKGGPAPELTPDPSPRSPSPQLLPGPPREKRRFAPQLIESSRRSRRAGDVGPATRPTDKTDITPYTNHIYAVRSRKRHHKMQSQARRESCDDEVAGHVFDLMARETERRLQEVALSAFPNSHIRIGGAEHFFVREGSDDDGSSSSSGGGGVPSPRGRSQRRSTTAAAAAAGGGGHGKQPPHQRRSGRDSSEEDVGWAIREMQEHHEQLSKTRRTTTTAADRISTLDLDRMSMDSPPVDLLWTTNNRRRQSSGGDSSSSSMIQPIGESFMPFIPSSTLPTIGEIPGGRRRPHDGSDSDSPPLQPIGETFMPYIPSAPPGRAADMPYAPAAAAAAAAPAIPSPGLAAAAAADDDNNVPVTRTRGPFGVGFGGYRNRDLAADREAHKLKSKAPPMLGKDLLFRRCPSPQQTKLEPEHLWSEDGEPGSGEGGANRDKTGQHGLWHGYCYSPEMKEALAPIYRPPMVMTPRPVRGPGDPFATAFGSSSSVTEEPVSLFTTAHSAPGLSTSEHRVRSGEPKGLHMLMGLEERLRKEKEAADLEDKISAEFTDSFVTQVYNYLSLGYPSMARAYDDELSKISRISSDDLKRDDDDDGGVVDGIGGGGGGGGGCARGYIGIEEAIGNDTSSGTGTGTGTSTSTSTSSRSNSGSGNSSGSDDDGKCPRWRALKLYIFEWARQHPDLDTISPLAWGVRERRGSWGI